MSVPRANLIAWGILLLPVVVIGVSFFPGHMFADMLIQIREARSGDFTNWHAPLLQALWSVLWVEPGAALIAQLLAFVAGAYLVLRAAFPPIPAALVTAAIALSPPVLGNLGTLMRDTWFLALLLLTFGLVVRAAQRPWPTRGRYLAVAVVAAWLTLASRQNAAAAIVLACIVIVALLLARRREALALAGESAHAKRRYGLPGAIAGGVALTVALMATQLGASAAIGVRDVHPEVHLLVYDLAAMSERERENLFPADVMPKRGMAPVDRAWNVDTMLGFYYPGLEDPTSLQAGLDRGRRPPILLNYAITDPAAESLRDAWTDAVRERPGTYLGERWTLWMRQIGVTRTAGGVYQPRIRPNELGFAVEFPALNEAANDYMEVFVDEALDGGPIFAIWIYLLAALAGAALLLRRGRPWPLIVVGALALSALAFQAGLFFGAMGLRYRFEFPCVVIGMLAAAVLLRLGWVRWRSAT